jgi:hypothetical protein
MTETLPDGQILHIHVVGEATLLPQQNPNEPHTDVNKVYDTIVVGSGYAGLSAAWGLRDRDILILEREPFTGGLAHGTKDHASGIEFVDGAAYITKPTGIVNRIYKSMGEPPIEKIAIDEPIDSRFRSEGNILGVWEEESRKHQDPGFDAVFKDMKRLEKKGMFDFNPPERPPKKAVYLDNMTAYDYFKPFGPQVVAFMDSYCQSALFGHLDQVSALAFLLFYVDELETRYTWSKGTGGGIYEITHKLAQMHKNSIRTRTHVREVVNADDGLVHVTYERDGKTYTVKAREAVVATPLKVSARMIPQMGEEQRKTIDGLVQGDYIVTTAKTSKDHYTKGYDTWLDSKYFSPENEGKAPSERANNPLTDIIASRWVATNGFKHDTEGQGYLAIYQGQAPPHDKNLMAPKSAAAIGKAGFLKARELIPTLKDEKSVDLRVYRWPGAGVLTGKGHLTKLAPILERSVGNIHLASNNQGTPAFETALMEGDRAAKKIRYALNRRALAYWLRTKESSDSWRPTTAFEYKTALAAFDKAVEREPRRVKEFQRKRRALKAQLVASHLAPGAGR